MNKSITMERFGQVLEITFNRPPVNAINLAASCELYDAFNLLQTDDELQVGIITAAGESVFSAGWDLKEFVANGDDLLETGIYDLGPGGLGGLPEFWGLKKPVIAAVNGKAIGGGFEMLLAADIIVAAEHAEFILPEVSLGFLPDGGGIQRVAKRLPYNVAAELMLTGRAMSAQEANHYGLVAQIFPANDLLPRARELAQTIAKGAPLALQALKEVMINIENLSVEESFKLTRGAWQNEGKLPLFEKMLRSDDYLEGSRAFAEKRQPMYRGC
ncbi:MAG: crotonobetainyl-CoA hydratase [Oceanospirillaceae bacterium]|jgi:crotonobetainyl-CoA hydratase